VAPALIVQNFIELPRAMVEVDRDAINLGSLVNQLSDGKIADCKAGLQDRPEFRLPATGHLAMDCRYAK
jgi:hypothetical protein